MLTIQPINVEALPTVERWRIDEIILRGLKIYRQIFAASILVPNFIPI